MANRINVNVNVRDNSRAGIRQVRNAIRRMNDDIRRSGGQAQFQITVDARSIRQARRTVRRLQRQLSGGPPVVIQTRIGAPDRNTFRRTVLRTLTSPARTAGSILGGIMSDGIGQGIVSGFRTAGPIGMAVLAAIIAASASVIGAALSGLIITALGGAFAAVGLVSAAQSDRIKKQWESTLGVLKEQFKSVGEPMIPVLDRAIERLETMAEKAGPALREALERTAPATEEFINKIMEGFEAFGAEAFQPIMDAWNVFAPAFGEVFKEFMRELGQAFAEMADFVKEHPTEIAAALSIVLDVIVLLIKTITFFGEAWAAAMQFALSLNAQFAESLRFVVESVLGFFGAIINGAADAFGWIPGLGPQLERAAEEFNFLKDTAVSRMKDIEGQAKFMEGALDRANKKRKLEADISSWQAKLKIARADLKKTSDQKAEAKLRANISDLENKVARARRQLNALNGKTARTYIRGELYFARTSADRDGNGVPDYVQARRSGGVIGHAQTGGVRNNLTLVGEAGPEVVDLPSGSRVRSNPDTRRLFAGGAGGGGGGAGIVFKSSGRRVDDLLLEILREAIHQRGGDPVVVLGGR